MTDRLDLPLRYREPLETLLCQHVPDAEVWAYGSRVNGRSHDRSDLDLVLRSPTLEPLGYEYVELVEALEQSNIPILIQVHDWARLPESFHREIERAYVVMQARGKQEKKDKWHKVALGDVVTLHLSSVDKKSKASERAVQLCNYMDVYANNFIQCDMDFMAATATDREITNCSLFPGDVIITKDSEKHDDIGVPALVRENIPDLVCGYHLAILRPNASVLDGAYLFYALSADSAQHQFHSFANGITRFGLRKADIEIVEIPLPPLPEQRAIAHILGALDDKIALNRRMNETLEQMARAIFQDWFMDFGPVRAKLEGREPYLSPELWDLFPDRLVDSQLGEIPEEWQVKPLGEVVELNPREPMKRGTIAPYIDMAALPTSGSCPSEAVLREFTSGTRFRNADSLLARITPCLENGKTAFVQSLPEGIVGWGSTEFIVMRAIHPVPVEYPYLLGRNESFREHAIQSMTGTSGRQRVQVDTLAPYLLPVPPADVWAKFSSLVGPMFADIETTRKESHSLAAQRDALLPKLVSGRVRVGEWEATDATRN